MAEEDKFENGANLKKSITSWKVRIVKTLMQGTQINNCPMKNLSATKKFSMPTLIEEVNSVVLAKYDFEYRRKIENRMFFWKFGTIRRLMHEKK